MRRYVLAPLLAATAGLLVALGLISFGEAVEEDATALLYGAALLALAAVAGAVAAGLWTGTLPQPPLPARARRLGAAGLSLAVWAGALAAAFLGWWNLASALEGEGGLEYTYTYTAAERVEVAAFGAVLGIGAAGLVIAGGVLAVFATTGRAPQPGPFAQSIAALGVLVAAAFFASLVLVAVLRGDYP